MLLWYTLNMIQNASQLCLPSGTIVRITFNIYHTVNTIGFVFVNITYCHLYRNISCNRSRIPREETFFWRQ
ncbi:hypothetical protein K437DRAFT_143162 [Tilletiaria anomala UBC 951]|uniref:Uncharacterized protein n=1 Tax=Tilletiaria anomala (strain ATCC 24038 / CBS 436.72 / UBC 951) TaxID=1037660 RepID=A0A066VZX2_TILAU|nr:uncharacterized protein K437DRAFT_143162 [Tilletiaria anomala UBC 951]KDN44100.1 hypothetical protein K437DRAFT_143162 [Tilletiaria anomala UBC 951]